jgi:hypothetical protein
MVEIMCLPIGSEVGVAADIETDNTAVGATDVTPANATGPAGTELLVVPESIPSTLRELAKLRSDMDKADTYKALRRIERKAEALKKLFAEVDVVRIQASEVIVFANHRIGEELTKLPVAKGATEKGTKRGTTRPPESAASLKEQVGSKNRGLRLKKLGAQPKPVVQAAVEKLANDGRDITITSVLKEVAAVERAAAREAYQARAEVGGRVEDLHALAASGKKFPVILADAPWDFLTHSNLGKDRSAERHYDTMALDELKALPVDALAADDAVLFMWATWPNLRDALALIEAWGFEYKTDAFLWVKQNRSGDGLFTGLGY